MTSRACRGTIAILVVCLLSASSWVLAQNKPDIVDPFSLIEGPMPGPYESMQPPQPGAVILPHVPADYAWWNGCSPTAAGMIFGWWEEAGHDAFPGSHRNLPATFSGTSSNPANYTDARGVIAGWAHKQSGMSRGLTYGSYEGHAPDSLADFMLTSNSGTGRATMAHGLVTFGAWDDPRTVEIESRKFTSSTVYTSSGWNFANYCAEIDAGRPVHLGLTSPYGGHSVIGVGYNKTGGKQNIILQTTWHSGLQEWQWQNETQSGYGFSVYGATLLNAVSTPTPTLSAYVSLAHTYVSDLTVVVGVGDPANPAWSTTVWNRAGGSDDNLAITDIDCTSLLSLFQNQTLQWFVKVTDSYFGDTGSILDFQVRYNFDQDVAGYQGAPVAIYDNQASYLYLTTVPEPAAISLLALGVLSLLRRRRS